VTLLREPMGGRVRHRYRLRLRSNLKAVKLGLC